jgi:hypothetical protein
LLSAVLRPSNKRVGPLRGTAASEKGQSMRILFGVTAIATMLFAGTALAGQTEGLIKKIDKDAMTMTLDDGKAYKLNAEMDVDSLKPGMDVVIAYDVTDGQNIVTDMELPDSDGN